MAYTYILRNGWGPGTLPADVIVLEHKIDGYKDIVTLAGPLTAEGMDYYDIREKAEEQEEEKC